MLVIECLVVPWDLLRLVEAKVSLTTKRDFAAETGLRGQEKGMEENKRSITIKRPRKILINCKPFQEQDTVAERNTGAGSLFRPQSLKPL